MQQSSPDNRPITSEAVEQHKKIPMWKVFLPVLIGLSVVALMFWHDAKKEDLATIFRSIDFSAGTIGFILLAWVFMMGRDIGLSWRFRELTDRQLSWGQAFRVDWMCEFTSCITPSSVGGSSMGMFFLNGEGIEIGRATTLMFTTLFLDELFFVVISPLVVLFSPGDEVFTTTGLSLTRGIEMTFWLVYSGITAWTIILFLGLIVKPTGIAKALAALFKVKFLRRWQPKVVELGANMIATSKSLKTKGAGFWLRTFGATALSWTSRFLVVNALFLAFVPGSLPDQWIILVRQFVVWVVLTVSPTPGGSGLSEWLFTEYYGNLIPTQGLALVIAIFWRVISYYIYLIIGSFVVPQWAKDTITRLRAAKQPDNTTKS